MRCTALSLLTSLIAVEDVWGHARLIEPPARNTLWRFGFDVPANFEDSELFCGGIKVQWADNHGKCGVCGDSFSDNRPRKHETGSVYDRNLTVRTYAPGEDVVLVVDVVTNHFGYFEFALCPRNDSTPESEQCFTKLRVKSLNSTEIVVEEDNIRYRLKSDRKGLFYLAATLPKDVICSKCVLRWQWRSANNWGVCPDGTQKTGCGPQETYRNCADVAIGSVYMGIRGTQGANAVPPRQSPAPSREYEILLAQNYHSITGTKVKPNEVSFDTYKSIRHGEQHIQGK